MRTTLQLDHDLLAAARVLARQRRKNLGAVISELARRALVAPPQSLQASTDEQHEEGNGCPLLRWTPAGAPVDLERVNLLCDDAPSPLA